MFLNSLGSYTQVFTVLSYCFISCEGKCWPRNLSLTPEGEDNIILFYFQSALQRMINRNQGQAGFSVSALNITLVLVA